MKRFIALLFFSVLIFTKLQADDVFKYPANFGGYLGLNFNMHSPKMTLLQIISEGNSIFDKNNTTLSGALGFIANLPIDNTFVFSGRLGWYYIGSNFESSTTNGNKLETGVSYIEITPAIQFHNLFPWKPLYLLAGLDIGIPISKSTEYSNPTFGTINPYFPSYNARLALTLGAGYVFKLTPNIFLTPELTFRIPMTNAVKTGGTVALDGYNVDSWSVTQIRAGVALTFALDKQEEEVIDPNSTMDVGFKSVKYYDKDGKFYRLERIRVEDVQYTELFPLVPYVFCDENSAQPSEKNQVMLNGASEAGDFSIQNLEADAMKINMATLDIIGSRMAANPTADLTITGTSDNKNEAKDKQLPQRRADYAKNYLEKYYKIASSRITVKSVPFPSVPTNPKVIDGDVENRRIEFSSNNPAILAPIVIERDNQRLAEPAIIEFEPFANSTDAIISWTLEISQAGEILRNYSGANDIESIQWVIYPNELTNKQIPVDYVFTAVNSKGLRRTASGSIPVEYISFSRKRAEELADRTISKFSLILFDFDKSDISSGDMNIITKYIIPSIKPNSTVKIYGYTDRIGKEEYNQQLAEKRAKAVKAAIESKVRPGSIEIYGVGELNAMFDNDLPLGRHLSRTVQVYVITPKN